MNTIRLLSTCVLLLLLTACHSKKREISALVKAWHGKEIILPDTLSFKVQGRDTACPDFLTARHKILHYIDTSGCTSCRTRFYDWTLLQKQTDSLHMDVAYFFIAWVKEYEELETLLQVNRCKIPCLYDKTGSLSHLNQFPTHPRMQTFLLDSLNRVVLIGNPVENPKLRKLYLKEIQK